MASKGNRLQEITLLSWGANSYGQLCSGHHEDTLIPSQCSVEVKLIENIAEVTGGGGHTVLLTKGAQLYVCGWNGSGQLGIGNFNNVSVPSPISGLSQAIAKVSCGWNHTIAITNMGEILTWGSNSFGQLGLPHIQRHVNKPERIPQQVFAGHPVSDVGAGMRHSVVITAHQKVYSWGSAKRGSLGLGPQQTSIIKAPTVVTSLPSDVLAKTLAVGSYHTLIVSTTGGVYACGCNEHGQCAVAPISGVTNNSQSSDDHGVSHDPAAHFIMTDDGSWVKCVLVPQLIPTLPPVTEVYCGWSHCMALTRDRKVLVWGRCDYGQLGLPGNCQNDKHRCCWRPHEIPHLKGAQQVCCGSEHNLAIGADGRLLSWGWNEHGMCGTGDQQDVMSPLPVSVLQDDSHTPILIGAGAGTSFALVQKPNLTSQT